MTEKQIEARIAELEKEQARLIEAANRRLGEIAGALWHRGRWPYKCWCCLVHPYRRCHRRTSVLANRHHKLDAGKLNLY